MVRISGFVRIFKEKNAAFGENKCWSFHHYPPSILSSTFGRHLASLSYSQYYLHDVGRLCQALSCWCIKFQAKSSSFLSCFCQARQSNPIQSTFVKRHQSSCLFRGASQKHRGKPLLLTISVLGSFTCITQHTGPTALRPIRRTKQLWLSVLLKDTSAATGNRTHILVFLTTPELESGALDH